jgi:multiple sugar transport system substrate-binding protein
LEENKKMIRRSKVIAAGALALALSAVSAEAQTTVTMWTFLDPAKTSPREIALKEMIEDFEKANPDITIKVEPQDFAQMPSKFFLGHRTGSNPDVVWIDAKNVGGLLDSGAGADLDKLLTANWEGGDADIYVRAGYDAALREGKRTALPLFHGASVIYYRKDMLAEAGIDPDSLKSWDDLREAAKTLTVDKDGDGRIDVWGLGMPLAPLKTESTPVLISMLEGDTPVFDGCTPSYDTELGRQGLEMTARLITDDKVTPQEALVLNVDDITDQIIAGRYAIAISSSLRFSTIAGKSEFGAENLGILPWPTWDGETSAPMPVSGWWTAAWSKSPQLDEAVKWIDYMVGNEGVMLWTKVGGQVPTRASLLTDPYFDQAENAWMKTMVSAWSTASWMEPTACNTRSLQADLNEATAQVILEGMDPSEALQSAEKKFMDAQ